MRRSIRLLLFLTLLPWRLLASPPVRTAPVYRITGVAVSSRDGAPIPYCRLQLVADPTPQDGTRQGPGRQGPPEGFQGLRGGGFGPGRGTNGPASLLEVAADVRGRFELTLSGPGSFRLAGAARGFRRQEFDAHDEFYSRVVLSAGAPSADVVFRLTPDAAISGVVLDEAAEPVRNAQVFAELPGTGPGAAARQAGFAQTDDRGRYEIDSLAPGAYRLRVQAQPWFTQGLAGRGRNLLQAAAPAPANTLDPSLDLVYPTTWYPGVQDEDTADLVQVAGGEDRQADFHLQAIPSTHLRVPRPEPAVDASNPRPVRGLGVLLTRLAPAGGPVQLSTTNGNETDFGGLSPGLYEIRMVGQDGRPDGDVRQIRIQPGSSGVLDLAAARPMTQVRLVLDGAAQGPPPEVLFVDTATGRSTSSNQGGFAGGLRRGGRNGTPGGPPERTVSLLPGRYSVYLGSGGDTYLVSLSATGAQVNGMTVEITGESPALTLHLASGKAEVDGLARLAEGTPSAGAMVLLVPATLGEPGSVSQIVRAQTNTDGSFVVPAVVPGKYILLALDHGWSVRWRDPATLAGYLAHGTPLELAAGGKSQVKITAQNP